MEEKHLKHILNHYKRIKSCTCFCNTVQRTDSWLVASRAEVQADGEWLASPHDEAVNAIEISTMVSVVKLTLQVPAINIQT